MPVEVSDLWFSSVYFLHPVAYLLLTIFLRVVNMFFWGGGHYVTSRKVAGSRPDKFREPFQFI
jgi:hypothetical protein